ncbi:EI24 domain-containing protein [Candidatus Sumerlaeota bacterium]|nr:EI24 domain-containing protein [Candidatus Sumerlaeota bacterium]
MRLRRAGINIILFLAFLVWGYSGFAGFLKSHLGEGDNIAWYWKGLAIIARIFFWLIALILVYFTFTPLALIIASPFNDYLGEMVEKSCQCEVADQRPLFRKIIGEALFAMKNEIKRLMLFLLVFLVLFPLNIIPITGSVIYLVLNFIWACYGLAFEFTGYATDRRHIRLGEKINLLNRNLAFFMGFGLITALFMMIPFLNVFAVSLSAVSETLAFCSVQKKEQ